MRKNKIRVQDIPEYYRYVRFKLSGKSGWLYYLDKKLSDEDKRKIEDAYGNVRFMMAQSQYAPEQKKVCLFVADRCF
jgi:hypothetical protein